MKDNAQTIIDSLEACAIENRCEECSYKKSLRCMNSLMSEAAVWIRHQKADIEKLNAGKETKCLRTHDEIDRFAQENAELRDQVYNLTMYLQDALWRLDQLDRIVNDDDDWRFTDAFNKEYDGMPGYNPAILEETEQTASDGAKMVKEEQE